jgi:hypothetical protein
MVYLIVSRGQAHSIKKFHCIAVASEKAINAKLDAVVPGVPEVTAKLVIEEGRNSLEIKWVRLLCTSPSSRFPMPASPISIFLVQKLYAH